MSDIFFRLFSVGAFVAAISSVMAFLGSGNSVFILTGLIEVIICIVGIYMLEKHDDTNNDNKGEEHEDKQ